MAIQKAPRTTGNTQSFKFVNPGDTLDGYYVRTTDEVINGSPAKKHLFMTQNGLTSVLGQANLYRQLIENKCEGIRIIATFTGEEIKLKGNKTMKVYDLSFDRDDAYTGADVSESNEQEPEGYEEEVEAEAAPPARPVAPARPPVNTAVKRAEAMALLGKSRPTRS